MSRALVVLPDDSATPILSAIQDASRTLRVKMFVFSDRALLKAVLAAAGSLDGRRELAIEVRDDEVVERLHKIARHDWEHSHPLDLSDEGLLRDLEGRINGSAELLGLDAEDTHGLSQQGE